MARIMTATSTESVSWWQRIASFRWVAVSPSEGREAEKQVFSQCGVSCTYKDTPVGDTALHSIHSISAGSQGPNVVFMPGYGAGSGFFYRNVAGLAASTRLHLVDWLGTGLSGRPAFRCRSREETEAWFIDSLETWRERNGVDRMVLVGHSLGGYLASNYALKYPGRVQHLVLVCPAGMSKKPEDWQPPEVVRSPWTVYGQVYRTVKRAWVWGMTPGMLARTIGPYGRRMTRRYTKYRMNETLGVPESEAQTFEPYLYQIWAAPGSGEFALRRLLAPFAWAHEPMEHRMDGLKVPVTFIYGENDWMDPAGAHRICEKLSKLPRAPADNDCQVITIPKTGHFTFLEQPGQFNDLLMETISHCLKGHTAQTHEHHAVHKGNLVDNSEQGVSAGAVEAAFVET